MRKRSITEIKQRVQAPPLFKNPTAGLLSALRRLDDRLKQAVQISQEQFGAEICADPFRGLYISKTDVVTLLGQEPGQPLSYDQASNNQSKGEDKERFEQLDWLGNTFHLSPFELEIVIIALAPEVDLRYERLFAYLQNDITRKWPSIDLILNLFCSSITQKLECRIEFSPNANLIREGIIELTYDLSQPPPPLLAYSVRINPIICNFLLGVNTLDEQLNSYAKFVEPRLTFDDLILPDAFMRQLKNSAIYSIQTYCPLRLHYQGPDKMGMRCAGEATASLMKQKLLLADLSPINLSKTDFTKVIHILCLQACLSGSLLFLEGLENIPNSGGWVMNKLSDLLSNHPVNIILSTSTRQANIYHGEKGFTPIGFGFPLAQERRNYWHSLLTKREQGLLDGTIETLSTRYQLTGEQIEQTVMLARLLNSPTSSQPKNSMRTNLFNVARAQSSDPIKSLAQKIEPRYSFNDIVLPNDTLMQLHEMCQRVAFKSRVMEEWGFDSKFALGKGINALFAGDSGTGKTMAAEVIAHELDLDLYKIDLSTVVSKYIGETEKNLSRIFEAAEDASGILFFDEADALFGKRTEVRDSHDRYANIEISYLLQKMEQFDGVAILATNLAQNLDEAFLRRLAFTVYFPFPGEEDRLRIWQGIWPPQTPLGLEVDLPFMAREFKLSGGNIKNVALSAAYLAVTEGGYVTMPHLLHAVQREYQKLGKSLPDREKIEKWKAAAK